MSVNTLEKKCLEIIINNFDRFLTSFSTEVKYQGFLPFIQKRWSTQILQQLFQRSLLKNEHLQIVLNKHITDLDFNYITNCDGEVILSRLRDIGEVLQKVSLEKIEVFNFDSIWFYLPNLHTIELQNSKVTNDSLGMMANNCFQLKNLNLFGCYKITNEGLKHIIKSKLALESLNLRDTRVTYKGVASLLKEITTLKTLFHKNVPKAILEVFKLNDLSREAPKKVLNLNNIEIACDPSKSENYWISVLKTCQSACPYINDLSVTQIITEKQLALCSSFPELRTAEIYCDLMSNFSLSINNFLELKGSNIRVMTLACIRVSIKALLINCPNLECLTYRHIRFEELELSSLNSNMSFPNLKKLHLGFDIYSSDKNVPYIAKLISSCPHLEELELNTIHHFTRAIKDAILNDLKSLVVLKLCTKVTATFLENVLRHHKSLKVLYIVNSGITPDEYDSLLDLVHTMGNKVNFLCDDYRRASDEE